MCAVGVLGRRCRTLVRRVHDRNAVRLGILLRAFTIPSSHSGHDDIWMGLGRIHHYERSTTSGYHGQSRIMSKNDTWNHERDFRSTQQPDPDSIVILRWSRGKYDSVGPLQNVKKKHIS